jgi:hypothetical protein
MLKMPENAKFNGNRTKVGKHHPGWAILATLPVLPGGRSAHELARLTGMSQQAISCVEHEALNKLKFRLQHSKVDLGMFKRSNQKSNTRLMKALVNENL